MGGTHTRPKSGRIVSTYNKKFWNWAGTFNTRADAEAHLKGWAQPGRKTIVKKVKGQYIALERRRPGDIT
jgi:hypothetical protein